MSDFNGSFQGLMVVLFAVGSVIGLYMLPTFVAMTKRRRNTLAIGVLNFLLGWTLLGWVGALVWACVQDREVQR